MVTLGSARLGAMAVLRAFLADRVATSRGQVETAVIANSALRTCPEIERPT